MTYRFEGQRKKFYKEDFDKFFAVEHVDLPYDDPDIKKLLDNHDVTKDEKYQESWVHRNFELFSAYLEKGLPNDRRLYVSFVSPEMGYGAFADLFIPEWTIIGVYAGVITNKVSNTDYAWVYHSRPLNEKGEPIKLRLNGRVSGNILRFINHSEKPNCNALHIPYKNRWYVVYVANQPIMPDQELTVDYGDNYWKERE